MEQYHINSIYIKAKKSLLHILKLNNYQLSSDEERMYQTNTYRIIQSYRDSILDNTTFLNGIYKQINSENKIVILSTPYIQIEKDKKKDLLNIITEFYNNEISNKNDNKIKKIILIRNSAKNTKDDYSHLSINISLYSYKEIVTFQPNHTFMSKFRILDEKNSQNIINKFLFQKENEPIYNENNELEVQMSASTFIPLPMISPDDKFFSFIDIDENQVIEFTREYPNDDMRLRESIYYRILRQNIY